MIEPTSHSENAPEAMATSKKSPAPKVQRDASNGRNQKRSEVAQNGWAGWAWIKNPITLFNGLLVLFTGVLAVSTGLLWWETKKAADAAQKSAEATHKAVELTQMQLRAYVRVNPGRFWELDPDHRTWLSYHLINSGETPAYSLRHGAVLKLAPFPLSDGYPFPDIKLGGETILTKEMTNLTGEVGVEKQLTQDEIITIFKGKDPRLYIFGETRYTTFGEEHSTRFCFSFAGSGNGLALVEKGDWGTVNSQIAASQLYWLHDPTYNKAN